MAKAIRQSARSKKWSVVRENGVIEHRGVSEREALILTKRLTKEEEAEKSVEGNAGGCDSFPKDEI